MRPQVYDAKCDYYRLLAVEPEADAPTIQRAFRQKAKALHPDLNPTRVEWAKVQFQQVNDAYRVLSNPVLRAAYDQERSAYIGLRYKAHLYKERVSWTPPPPPAPPQERDESHTAFVGEKKARSNTILLVVSLVFVVNLLLLMLAFYLYFFQ